MKILILPSKYITDYSFRNFRLTLTYLKNVFTKAKLNFEDAKQFYYLMEHYHYSHIPLIIGKENTFIVGNYYSDYRRTDIPKYSRYPSLHKSPDAQHISFKEAKNNIKNFDVVIIGIRSEQKGLEMAQIAKKNGVLVAYLDYVDHPQIYQIDQKQYHEIIYRGLKKNIDFDIFFKHDVPLDFNDEDVHSICPMPIKLENYPLSEEKKFNDRNINISFLGRLHNELQQERTVVADYLENNFENVYFKRYGFNEINRQSLLQYSDILKDSKIVFSPSGKVWDSVRHAEAAIYKSVPLISKPYCKLANNISVNSENSINYNVSIKDKKFEITNKEKLKFDIYEVLNNESKFNTKALNWFNEIKNKNTLLERSRYLINIIKKKLNEN